MLYAPYSAAALILMFGLLQAPEPPEPEWTTLQPADWDFSLSFPVAPVQKSRNVFSFSGRIKQTLVLCQSEGAEFLAQRVLYPLAFTPRLAAERLAIEKKGYLSRRTELIAEKSLTFGQELGEEFTYKSPQPRGKAMVLSRTRHFIKATSYYSITVTSAPNKPLPDTTDRFLNSLKFGSTPSPIDDLAPTATPPSTMPAAPQALANQTTPLSDPTVIRTRNRAMPSAAPTRTVAKIKVADATPEEALHTFLLAIVAHDPQALQAVAIPHRALDRLLDGPVASPEDFARYEMSLNQKPFRRLKPGERVTLPSGELYTVRSDEVGRYLALLFSPELSLPVNVQQIQGRWKVIADPFIVASRAASTSKRPQ